MPDKLTFIPDSSISNKLKTHNCNIYFKIPHPYVLPTTSCIFIVIPVLVFVPNQSMLYARKPGVKS